MRRFGEKRLVRDPGSGSDPELHSKLDGDNAKTNLVKPLVRVTSTWTSSDPVSALGCGAAHDEPPRRTPAERHPVHDLLRAGLDASK